MIDGRTYDFDSDPASINGCTDAALCEIHTGLDRSDSTTAMIVRVSNAATGTNLAGSATDPLTVDTTHVTDATFARLTSYRVAVMSAVPEPQSWALMLAGFGLTGAALRRWRGRPAAVAA
ncbi:PEPxxWA-CTERM sorting domain-containing protein [Sphingomonas sp. KR1UV-12]|uniref:PEPxxWA-CTERM sorting domain-containing protein n=1 Tax=Sphingomonas aurea TaxID=3063994 RepID=A0ABT9EGA0_9SPHN|nr:PEPxxWA-CTERM sorting domain-containing protein [Sphingomonas sp. KR1UV-12]MDP1025865.1 PEPxxWA-CTERM sorting domain-containing protein [Sphingomonas sp. KR1UV-12]